MKLYTVIFIDTDDLEDSVFEYFHAEDEGDLEVQVRRSYYAEDEDDDYVFSEEEEDEWQERWGFTILYSEVPTQN